MNLTLRLIRSSVDLMATFRLVCITNRIQGLPDHIVKGNPESIALDFDDAYFSQSIHEVSETGIFCSVSFDVLYEIFIPHQAIVLIIHPRKVPAAWAQEEAPVPTEGGGTAPKEAPPRAPSHLALVPDPSDS